MGVLVHRNTEHVQMHISFCEIDRNLLYIEIL